MIVTTGHNDENDVTIRTMKKRKTSYRSYRYIVPTVFLSNASKDFAGVLSHYFLLLRSLYGKLNGKRAFFLIVWGYKCRKKNSLKVN